MSFNFSNKFILILKSSFRATWNQKSHDAIARDATKQQTTANIGKQLKPNYYYLLDTKICQFPTTMIATTLIPATNTVGLQLPCFATNRAGRKPFVSVRSSLVIETAEDQASAEIPQKSVARRLILLRHAKSSWENRSLRGTHFWSLCILGILQHFMLFGMHWQPLLIIRISAKTIKHQKLEGRKE